MEGGGRGRGGKEGGGEGRRGRGGGGGGEEGRGGGREEKEERSSSFAITIICKLNSAYPEDGSDGTRTPRPSW